MQFYNILLKLFSKSSIFYLQYTNHCTHKYEINRSRHMNLCHSQNKIHYINHTQLECSRNKTIQGNNKQTIMATGTSTTSTWRYQRCLKSIEHDHPCFNCCVCGARRHIRCFSHRVNDEKSIFEAIDLINCSIICEPCKKRAHKRKTRRLHERAILMRELRATRDMLDSADGERQSIVSQSTECTE